MSFSEKTVISNQAGTQTAEPNVSGELPVIATQPSGNYRVELGDSASVDAFGRLRVGEPLTLIDAKQTNESLALLWDDAETSGSGTSSAYQTNKAATRISVSGTTAGMRVRQTFQRFNYQTGKSQRILATCNNLHALSGNLKGFGYGDDKNGLFLISDGGTLKFRRRTYVTGSAVDNDTVVNTTLPNGTVMDLTKTMILDVDFEWLGVGRIRAGYIDAGSIQYFFEYTGANSLTEVYMSTPNLPIRYWIENDGAGAADYFDHICCTVMSEGGQSKTGLLQHEDSGTVSGLTSGNTYAILGMRLKSTHLDVVSLIENISLICTTANDNARWEIIFNPTVAGTFTYSGKTNSAMEVAVGTSANTVTGGYIKDGGYFTTSLPVSPVVPNAKWLGSFIDGTPEEIILAVTPITANVSTAASWTWRELS